MKKWLAPLALLCTLLALPPAAAQWQVCDHCVPIGNGAGVTGFNAAAPGAAGLPLVSNGAAADPSFQQTISTANKVLHVSIAGNDANDGLSWATAKLTIQAGIDAASTAGKVLVGAGTYTLSTPVYMRAGVALECVPGAVIAQANAANLQAIVDFSGFFGGNVATGASIRYCTIDGNRANNTGRLQSGIDGIRIVYYGNTSFVTIDNNIIRNGPGYGIHGASQVGLVVSNNTISNTENHQVALFHTAGGFDSDCRIFNNNLDNMILVAGVNGCIVANNRIVGTLIGGVSNPMLVNVSGTTVTWVSGPNFSGVPTGLTLIANNGTIQSEVKQVNSSTSLTLNTSFGTFNNVLAMIGTNDLLGACGVQRTIITGNYVRNGSSFGLSFCGTTTAKFEDVIISNNLMFFQGKNGFALLGGGGGAGGIGAQNVVITGNQVVNAIQGGQAGCPAPSSGGCAHSYVITESTQTGILVEGNFAQDNTNLTHSWLSVSGLAVGSVGVGPNYQVGAGNPGIFGGISSITLSAGWGNTAATSAIVSFGHSVIFTITANGTGIAANPTITVNTVATKMSQAQGFPPGLLWVCKQVGGTGAVNLITGEQNSFTSQIGAINWNGTPVAGSTYQIICQ